MSCATGDGTFGWSNAASLHLIENNIALVHVELCKVSGRVRMLSFNTCGARIIWLCACTNLGLGTHGSTIGNTGVKTCTVRGLF